ncbi:hypothetical protein GOQ30_17180 [Flavobacterium sp. TP390]|uniref:Uncharacterized protein n=1 Tax=Flavobacterium profundi TaxID=1774945 RepID=A0A6I4IVF9_9FLAO|nr:DUF6452 family protein [Flavobacterium profundi]MVO10907.1 hypothetical protein [Flavobacterium profundi]
MKKISVIVLIILVLLSFWNCEKDDLCAESTPTTPRVVIEFYDAVNPDVAKSVTNLKYFEVNDADEGISDTLTTASGTKILIPLKTFQNENTVRFKLILNGSDDDVSNDITDFVRFNYSKEDIYISRACGYKTIFELNATDGFEKTTNWIQVGGIVDYSVTNENETHVKIYF